MVMDASPQPSPQSVGREFVRQYYTLLNKAPNHLHRFYNNSSSFVHGGLDPSNRDAAIVIGQKQIHNKIQQLNFRDCHAKISQVDSQATLGNGVVVQVTGELSNDGQPMRRFTQTFVLAAQSPKKYYVHNDIFRYQDIWSEDEADEPPRAESTPEQVEPEQEVETSVVEPPAAGTNILAAQQQQQQLYYSSNVQAPVLQAPAIPPYVQPATAVQQPQQLNGLGGGGGVAHEEPLVQPTMETSLMEVKEEPAVVAPPAPIVAPAIGDWDVEPIATKEPEPTTMTMTEEKMIPEPVSNEPKTYANLVKSAAGTGAMTYSAAMGPATGSVMSSSTLSPPPIAQKFPETSRFEVTSAPSNAPKPFGQRPLRASEPARSDRPPRIGGAPGSSGGAGGGIGGSMQQQYGDNHQLFLGNIPHAATEDDLRDLFSKFGQIVDLRILSKPAGAKLPGQRPPPNYGFLTYDDPAAVQECLANVPLYFPDGSPDGQKLNVEEKKARVRGPGETGGRIGSGSQYINSSVGNGRQSLGGGAGGSSTLRSNIGGGGAPRGGPLPPRNSSGGGGGGRPPFQQREGGRPDRGSGAMMPRSGGAGQNNLTSGGGGGGAGQTYTRR